MFRRTGKRLGAEKIGYFRPSENGIQCEWAEKLPRKLGHRCVSECANRNAKRRNELGAKIDARRKKGNRGLVVGIDIIPCRIMIAWGDLGRFGEGASNSRPQGQNTETLFEIPRNGGGMIMEIEEIPTAPCGTQWGSRSDGLNFR